MGWAFRRMNKGRFGIGSIAGTKAGRSAGWASALSLVKAIVEAHRGRVEVASPPGEGSEFTVCLPVEDTDSKAL